MVYIDGYNLYYGVLKDTPYRWADVRALCQRFLKPHQQVVGVKYFTARVAERGDNPDQGLRQQVYLRALETLPDFEIHYGNFTTHEADRCLVNPPKGGRSPIRRVIETREKGSDVNLASHLLIDSFCARYDLAIVVSNDSDLAFPVANLRERGLRVGILNPHAKRNFELAPVAVPTGCFYRKIQRGHVIDCQLPDQLEDADGVITKPPTWSDDQEAIAAARREEARQAAAARRRRRRSAARKRSKTGKSRPKAAPQPRGRNQRGR